MALLDTTRRLRRFMNRRSGTVGPVIEEDGGGIPASCSILVVRKKSLRSFFRL